MLKQILRSLTTQLSITETRTPERGAAIAEYVLVIFGLALVAVSLSTFAASSVEKLNLVNIALGGGSTTSNAGTSAIAGCDFYAALANGIVLWECCGRPGQVACPAYLFESKDLPGGYPGTNHSVAENASSSISGYQPPVWGATN